MTMVIVGIVLFMAFYEPPKRKPTKEIEQHTKEKDT